MTSFIRSATWITPEFAAEFAPEGRTAFFSERQKEEWRTDKRKYRDYRKAIESTMNGFFGAQFKASQASKDSFDAFSKTMRERLSRRPEIADVLGKVVVLESLRVRLTSQCFSTQLCSRMSSDHTGN
jgi:hypothetical protein